MASIIRIKRRASGGDVGAPLSLANAELAFNEADDILYYGKGISGTGTVASNIIPIAGPGAFVKLADAQTISGNKTFTGTISLGNNASATTPSANDSSTKVATTAFVLGQANSTAGTITMNGTQAAGTSSLYARADHVHASDTSKANLASPTFTGTPAAPTAAADTNTTQLATTAFVVGQAASTTPNALGTVAVGTSLKYARADHVHAMPTLNQVGAPTASVSLNSQSITNLADPTNAQDAATKAYVDAARSGLDVKQSVRLASVANVAVTYAQAGGASTRGQITAAPNALDGVNLAANDRILLKDQSTGAQNGIWVVSTLGTGANGVWDRATDFDQDAEVTAGAFTFVAEGDTNADSGWVLTTNDTITIGGASGTALAFAQFSGAGQITAGAGLIKNGNTIDAAGTTNRILVNADSIDIASTYVGQTSITTLGTIDTGTWNGTTIGVAYGGTGTAALTGILKGNGTSAFTAAVDGTDYLSPNAIVDGGAF